MFPALVIALFLGGRSDAQTTLDHLTCYSVRDPRPKTQYSADLKDALRRHNCTITVPARLSCMPTEKSNVLPSPPGGGGVGEANPFFCYRVRCPRGKLPPLTLGDQFGTRTVKVAGAVLVCAPAVEPTSTTSTTTGTTSTATTTTTTSSTTSTTSTTNPGCSFQPGLTCGGSCDAGTTCLLAASGQCQCVPIDQQCGAQPGGSCGGLCAAPGAICAPAPGGGCVCRFG